MGESILKLQQIRKSFDHTEVLKGVDLEVAQGEFITLLGAAGFRKCDPGGKRHYGLGTQ